MGVFNEGGGYPDQGNTKIERCKRDYEADIARMNERRKATVALKTALEGYVDLHGAYGQNTFTLTGLYGSLALEERSIFRDIELTQEAWENDK